MKKPCIALLLGVTLTAVGGCSTAPVADDQSAYALDYDRMALIESIAHRRGVTIIWVNAPRQALN